LGNSQTAETMSVALEAKQKALRGSMGPQEAIDACKSTLVYKAPPDPILKVTVKGHTQKVYDCNFSADGMHVATGGQEGFVFVTNIASNLKICKPVKVSFVMGVALNPSSKLLASGGMDNKITITDIASDPMNPVTKKEMAEGHDGYISRLQFVGEKDMISTSGDGKAILWDVTTGKSKTIFEGHTGDCNSISIPYDNDKIFATGSTDKTCRIWDLTSGKCVRTFQANAEVNCVAMHPTGKMVMTGNDNGNHQQFDVGSYNPVDTGKPKNKKMRIMAAAMSRSGRYTYFGGTTGQICSCDTFCVNKWKLTSAHEKYVCAMSMAPDGSALATSSYDSTCKIWAGGPQAAAK